MGVGSPSDRRLRTRARKGFETLEDVKTLASGTVMFTGRRHEAIAAVRRPTVDVAVKPLLRLLSGARGASRRANR